MGTFSLGRVKIVPRHKVRETLDLGVEPSFED
jgi:hypothetical protein